MQLQPNLVIANKFRLNHMIGRGGMGSVWHATHLGLDTPCAVKFIEGEFAQHPEAHARFEREAKAAAMLRSGHVVQILDHGVCDGTPYIAMELLEGEDLGKRIAARGKLSPPEVQSVVSQVCRALSKAHQAGIVHRDLKPDNIYIVREDDREVVKVLDFGIAKKASTSLDSGSNTKTGAMLGTPYYMSPEQAQGTKSVDHRSDLWSLAVIVFQCLTGRLPFESEALGDLLVKIIVSAPPVPSQYGSVPAGFDAWWAKASSQDPNKRFSSAKEFADSLGMVLGVSVTDVTDRRLLKEAMERAAVGGAPPAGTVAMPLTTPRTPQPYPESDPRLPPPGYGAMNTPNAIAQTGVPVEATQGPAKPSTGDGMARSYAGSTTYEVPKKGSGLVIGAVAGVLVLLAAGGVGVGIYVTKKSSAKGDTTATATATTTASATTTAATMATATATATASTTAAATTTPEATATATALANAKTTATAALVKPAGTAKPPVTPPTAATTPPVASVKPAVTAKPAACGAKGQACCPGGQCSAGMRCEGSVCKLDQGF